MGVYVENIRMPEDGEHPLWISLHSDGTVEYNANKGDGWQMTTAIHVPPHGRLIDADVLADHKFVCIPHVSIDGKDAGTAYRLGWNTAIEAVMENAETIIGGE